MHRSVVWWHVAKLVKISMFSNEVDGNDSCFFEGRAPVAAAQIIQAQRKLTRKKVDLRSL